MVMDEFFCKHYDYSSPEVEIIELAIEGVLCESYGLDEGEW